jgi:hypothetical protein
MLSVPGLEQFYVESKYLSFLLQEDTSFVKQQMAMRKTFQLDSLAFRSFKIIPVADLRKSRSQEEFWELINKYGTGYYSVSMPIFNSTNDLCYFKLSFFCNGHCGNGLEILAEKKGIRWVIKEKFGGWVS